MTPVPRIPSIMFHRYNDDLGTRARPSEVLAGFFLVVLQELNISESYAGPSPEF